jgi:ubiquitin C-terminal hydrolase
MVEQTDVQTPQPAVSSGDLISVVVLDSCHYPSPPKRIEIVLSKNTTGENLVNKIADECGYTKDVFEVKWGKLVIEPDEHKTLGELGVPPKVIISASKRQGKEIVTTKTPNMITMHETSNSSMSISATATSSASSSSPTALIPYGPNPSPSSYSYSSTGYSSYSYSWSQPQGKSSTGYIGLSNQGATCYMNSLIQTLFMTPEFRNGLYNWSFEEKIRNDTSKSNGKGEAENGKSAKSEEAAHGANGNGTNGNGATKEEESGNGNSNNTIPGLSQEEREKKERSSIPLQLQRLFARLQLCDVQAVKTKDLTKSFGWEDADAFTQHDVQELCRVLFDALEKNFQGTKQANLVNDLYQGKMKDYVQCKECKHESARVDQYLDIPLVIRGFGETIPVKSVEEALQKFVQPEVLDKDNQYSCEKCAKKVDAIKGLKIEKFPYLLTLQLKRFDFDFQTMRRIKLNDRVTFPLYLDLNPFIFGKRAATQTPSHKDEEEEEEEEEEIEEAERGDKGKGRAEHQDYEYRHRLGDSDEDIVPESQARPQEESFEPEPDFEAPPPVVTKELPYVYELFSVMIHRGSSMGGHYYAYVKSFDTGKWYEFNDAIVSEISVNEVKKAFGGDEDGGYSGMPRSVYNSYRSNANAYMLMYRQIEPDRNKKPMTTTDIPEALRNVIEAENGAAKQKKKAEELEREMVKLKIFYNGEDKSLSMHKSTTLAETTTAAVKLFGLADKYQAGNYRLRNYTHTNELPGDTFTGRDLKTLEELNLFANHYTTKSLLLETKDLNEEFEDFNSSMMLFRVAKYNPTTVQFDPVVNVYVSKSGNVGDLREAIAQKLGVPKDKQNLYKEPTYPYCYPQWHAPTASLIDRPNEQDLRHCGFIEPEKFYVEYTDNPIAPYDDNEDEEDRETDDKESPLLALLEKIKNTIEIKFNLPGKEDFDQKISVDKNMLVKDFKDKIQPIVGLPIDDFKIKRGSAPHLYELVNDSESLSDVSVRDGMPLTIEKGKPLKEGESNYVFEYLDLTKDADNFTELFEIPVHDDMLVSDVKQMILPLLQQKGFNVTDPAHIRLRDVSSSQYSRRVGKVFQDSFTVKKATLYVYSKRVVVQILNEPESLTNQEKELCFFVQHFHPSTFELGKKEDFVISEDATLDELRERLGAKYGIEPRNVGVVRVDNYYNFYDDPELLDVPEMGWDRPTIAYSIKNTVGDTMMMRHGYLMLFRDNTEKLKELTKEEKDAIKKETNKRKSAQNQNTPSYSFWNRKERALKIHSEG